MLCFLFQCLSIALPLECTSVVKSKNQSSTANMAFRFRGSTILEILTALVNFSRRRIEAILKFAFLRKTPGLLGGT